MDELQLLEFLYAALQSPNHGVKIETDDAERLRQRLYPVKNSKDEFTGLTLRVLSSTSLWIVKARSDAKDNRVQTLI